MRVQVLLAADSSESVISIYGIDGHALLALDFDDNRMWSAQLFRSEGAEFQRIPCPDGDTNSATVDAALLILRDENSFVPRGKNPSYSMAQLGSSLAGLVAETRESCASGQWVDRNYLITDNAMSDLWLDTSGWFYISDAQANAASTGGYLRLEHLGTKGNIYYGLSSLLNSYVVPGEKKDPIQLSIYRSTQDRRPTRVVLRVAYCSGGMEGRPRYVNMPAANDPYEKAILDAAGAFWRGDYASAELARRRASDVKDSWEEDVIRAAIFAKRGECFLARETLGHAMLSDDTKDLLPLLEAAQNHVSRNCTE